MSEEQAKPAAPAAAAKEAPPPPPPGELGKKLEAKGFKVEHLGPDANGTEMVRLQAADALKASEYLKNDCGFDLAVCCSGMDWKTHRESVYHVYGTENHQFFCFKVNADANEHAPSLTTVWPALDWHERESYDLFGIQYDGHPKLERILMPSDWLGHPMRKDYKVTDPRLVWNER